MEKYAKLKAQAKKAVEGVKQECSNFSKIADEYARVGKIYENPQSVFDDIDAKFAEATKLNAVDISFLFFATALQCVRQYVLTPFDLKYERKSHTETEKVPKKIEKITNEHVFKYNKKNGYAASKLKQIKKSDRSNNNYNPSLEEILFKPVPYDVTFGSPKFNLDIGGGFGHRAKTLGHDPLLGWIFGTANIATSTLTMWNLSSYHIKTGFTVNGSKKDEINSIADTFEIFVSLDNKIQNEGKNGRAKVLASLIKEGIHLASDVNSKVSLPFPFSATYSPELAKSLSEYGIDSANILTVGKQAGYSVVINYIIAILHGLVNKVEDEISSNLCQVRTRKILMYSNILATSSNLIAVAVAESIAITTGNTELAKKGMKYLDLGGLLVTLHRIVFDTKFINNIKKEFLENEWYNTVYGEEYDFMEEKDGN